MSVDLVMEDARWKTLDLPQIANTAFKETLSQLNMRSENFICCILACSSKRIKGLNVQFRGKNNATNVLSFPSTPKISRFKSSSNFEADIDPFELGDIAIAYEVCKKEADVSKVDFEHHVYHLIIHSVDFTINKFGYCHSYCKIRFTCTSGADSEN